MRAITRRHVSIRDLLLTGLLLVVLSGSFLLLTGSTVNLSTVQWDEFTDLVIASRLSERPLSGHTYDGSQARFPMYVTALAFLVGRATTPDLSLLDMLPVSRWISIGVSVLAIWATYLLGRRLFSPGVGMLAATLLTFSPFFLHFSRAALTQGDAFTTTPVLLSILTFEQFHRKRSTFWLAGFSFCLALAIAAKFFLVVLVPAFMLYQLLVYASARLRDPDPYTETGLAGSPLPEPRFVLLAMGAGLLSLLAVLLSFQRGGQTPLPPQLILTLARAAWVMALISILLCCVLALRRFVADRKASAGIRPAWRLTTAWLAILPLAAAMVLALFPSHIFNPTVLRSLFERTVTMDGNTDLLATAIDSVKLYTGLLLFKLGLPFGIVTYAALVWAAGRTVRNRSFLLIMLVLALYGLLIVFLPLRQPFWLMSVYPLLLLALSGAIAQAYRRAESSKLRWAWLASVVFAAGWLAFGLTQVYPTYGYYGYELVGDTWLGMESRGHRSLVVVTNDGSATAIDWLRKNAPQDALVVSYLDDPHIIDYLGMVESFPFDLRQALRHQERSSLLEDLERAEFIVVRPFRDISFAVPWDDPSLVDRFGAEPVFSVLRGRGVYKMPVVLIYQRLQD